MWRQVREFYEGVTATLGELLGGPGPLRFVYTTALSGLLDTCTLPLFAGWARGVCRCKCFVTSKP